MKKEPHELVYHHNGDQAPTWDCMACSEVVHTQSNGSGITWLRKAQEEHICPADAAKARLPKDLKRIEAQLLELGVRIELHYRSYEDVELMLVDSKTSVEYHLGVEELG